MGEEMHGEGMTYASVCSGVGGFGMGFAEAGITPILHCEFDNQAASVLRRHYPEVSCVSDIHDVRLERGQCDVLIGGIPCQDYSVAGKRAGLAGDKGALFWQFHRLASEARPRIAVIENVPGLLSSDNGRSLATILAAMEELGYRWAYRTLDARFFGVPQSRRRVFIVFSLGDYSCAEILFEPGCLPRDSKTRREAGEEVAGILGGGSGKRGHTTSLDVCGAFVPSLAASGAGTARTGNARTEADMLVTHSMAARETGKGFWTSDGLASLRAQPGGMPENIVACPLTTNPYCDRASEESNLVAHCIKDASIGREPKNGPQGKDWMDDQSFCLQTNEVHAVVFDPRQVTSPHNRSNLQPNEPCHTLSTDAPMIAFGIDGDANANLINAMKAKATGSIQNGVVAFTATDYKTGKFEEQDTSRGLTTSAERSRAAPIVASTMQVRRLTPLECERLMGWPDDWCKYGAVKRGKSPHRDSTGETMIIDGELHDIVEMADGPRYRMCGNGVVGPVSAWLAKRIARVTAGALLESSR
jgi:DNA (cytosine-5)-methyltransferase 1